MEKQLLSVRLLDLPEARSANEISKKNLIIKIDKNGFLEFEDKVLTSDLLLKELTQKLISNKSTIVEIHADKNIEFGSFGNIIELARQAGAEEFIFATEDPQ